MVAQLATVLVAAKVDKSDLQTEKGTEKTLVAKLAFQSDSLLVAWWVGG